MSTKTAVVVGALGVIGRYIVDKLTSLPDWQVIGLSRWVLFVPGLSEDGGADARRTFELQHTWLGVALGETVGYALTATFTVLVVVGLVVGLGIVWLSEAALTRVLFETTARDPSALVAAGSLLIVVALAACVPPAIRALRVDPVEGLRAE